MKEKIWGQSEEAYTDKQLSCNVSVTQLCQTLCNHMDCSPSGSSVHGILQARTLEWVAIPFSRGSSQPRDWNWLSCIAGRFFTIWVAKETLQRKKQLAEGVSSPSRGICRQRQYGHWECQETSTLGSKQTQCRVTIYPSSNRKLCEVQL